jgi:hypothetical protein
LFSDYPTVEDMSLALVLVSSPVTTLLSRTCLWYWFLYLVQLLPYCREHFFGIGFCILSCDYPTVENISLELVLVSCPVTTLL